LFSGESVSLVAAIDLNRLGGSVNRPYLGNGWALLFVRAENAEPAFVPQSRDYGGQASNVEGFARTAESVAASRSRTFLNQISGTVERETPQPRSTNYH